MRTSAVGFALLLMLALASAAQAQGMGLDLSGSEPPPTDSDSEDTGDPGAVGMDLSADTAGAELLPRAVILGLDTPERAGAAVAGRWLRGLYGAVRGVGGVALGASLKETKERLSDGYETALKCTSASCLAEPSETLDANLLVTARLALEDDGWTFRLWTYDHDRGVVETDSLTGRNPKDAKFQQGGARLLADRLKSLAKPRSVLKVNVNVSQAVVRLGEKTLGVGSLEARVPPVESTLTVEAEEYSTYTKKLSLKPGETSSVDVYLESSGPAPEGPGDEVASSRKKKSGPSGPSIFKRPALYTAVAGLVAVGVGAFLGSDAKKVGDRAVDADNNGVIDISRGERIDAQSQANLATALMVGGAAVTAGSVVWLVVVPTKSAPPPVAPGTDTAPASSTGLHVVFGGSF
ncbi:PEGA domain-containing protein [Stigmatella hybrida]|uniref:PEGA domain-containing protein n=1 Tax=Stigmatella hybrida TaxID=394097 RepID=UPI001CDA5BDB|nr:PEGA domain-containing protein [Stigmatella hybrida]